ncbi:hypothetical protein A9F13_01g00704 [Clavispora lusitaniae]|uniref:Defect at low temperature protein 1 n=1 Tax=Clavispora lusitaniae TaxID=36911 RepID=A0AA91Q3I6_CLALS|nr:hypothetical protein A9F13_01g00704 [Clavispora lusitaniae]
MPSSTLSSSLQSLRSVSRYHGFSRLLNSVVPSRVFKWLYSFSLAIFVIITAAFIVVTPLDIVVQTWQSQASGLKVSIILVVLTAIVVVSSVLYLSRLYNGLVVVRQIPARSVYVPLEKGDMSSDVLEYVESRLRWCVGDVKPRAGPLANPETIFPYPGLAPPTYIQQRNIRMGHAKSGTFLPPDCVYEDIVDSLGLKLRAEGYLFSHKVPAHYTMREILLSLGGDAPSRALALSVVYQYEALKFGPGLIRESQLTAFLVQVERLSMNVVGATTTDVASAKNGHLAVPGFLYRQRRSSSMSARPKLSRTSSRTSVMTSATGSSSGSVIRARLRA